MTISEAVVVVAALAGQPGARSLDPADIQQTTLRAVYRATQLLGEVGGEP